jgi:hypothetical protein
VAMRVWSLNKVSGHFDVSNILALFLTKILGLLEDSKSDKNIGKK